MARYARRSNRRTRRRNSIAKKRRGLRRRRSSVKKLVRRVVRNAGEHKRSQYYNLGTPMYNSLASASNFNNYNVMTLTPAPGTFEIQQGTSITGRIGNKIRVQRNMWTLVIHPRPYNSTDNVNPCPCVIKAVLFYERSSPTVEPTNIQQDFFQFGNLIQPMTGDVTDMASPFNTEQYRILKTWEKKVGYSQATGTGGALGYQYYANNDFSYNWKLKINVKKYMPKTVTWVNNALTPKTRGVYLALYYGRADGTVDTNAAQAQFNVQWVGDFRYTDN